MKKLKFLLMGLLIGVLAGCLGSNDSNQISGSSTAGLESSKAALESTLSTPTLAATCSTSTTTCGSSCGSTCTASTATRWTYTDGYYEKTSSGWVEHKNSGTTFNFTEYSNNGTYVVLYDSSRSLYVLLAPTKSQYASNGAWVDLCPGSFTCTTSSTCGSCGSTCTASTATRWNYNDGYYEKTSSGWVEHKNSGTTYNFTEYSNNGGYVVLYDSSRSLYILLGPTKSQYASNGAWVDLCAGSFSCSASTTPPTCGGGSGSTCTAATATRWDYTANGGGYFLKSGSTWTEYRTNGTTQTFSQQSNDGTYIVMYDSSRSLTLRISASKAEYSSNGNWVDLFTGSFNCSSTSSCTASTATRWDYSANGGGYFIKSGTAWTEYRNDGSTQTFAQQSNDGTYIVMYDATRGLTLRLSASRAEYLSNGSWVDLFSGSFSCSTTSSCTPSTATRWEYTANNGGYFSKSGSTWTEYRTNGTTQTFAQQSNDGTYVVMYDASRNLTLRLSATKAEYLNSSSNWVELFTGVFKCSSSSTLSAPTMNAASSVGSSSLTLNWTAVSGATRYAVYKGDGTFVGYTTSTSYTVSGLEANHDYTYYVQACTDSSCGASSSSVTVKTLSTAGLAAPAVSVEGTTASTVTLKWLMVDGATKYLVYRDGVYLGQATELKYIDSSTQLKPSTSYTYTVQACNAANVCSVLSSEVTGTTLAAAATKYNVYVKLAGTLGGLTTFSNGSSTVNVSSITGQPVLVKSDLASNTDYTISITKQYGQQTCVFTSNKATSITGKIGTADVELGVTCGVPTLALNCAGAIYKPAKGRSGVSIEGTLTIPYTNGNGLPYAYGYGSAAHWSDGATDNYRIDLKEGTLTTSNGNLIFTVRGTAGPNQKGTATFDSLMSGTKGFGYIVNTNNGGVCKIPNIQIVKN